MNGVETFGKDTIRPVALSIYQDKLELHQGPECRNLKHMTPEASTDGPLTNRK